MANYMAEPGWWSVSLDDAVWEHYPQKEIVSGDMDSRVARLRDGNGEDFDNMRIAFFRAEPSVSRTTFRRNETLFVIEGRAVVHIGGETLEFVPGVAARFEKGREAELHVSEPLTCFTIGSN
jgi:uncharacterized cupin superfamily protein